MKNATFKAYRALEDYTVVVGLAIALVWANLWFHSYESFAEYDLGHLPHFLGHHHLTPHFIVNDLLMYAFFLVVIIEVRRDLLLGGPLGTWKSRLSISFATAGGVLGPYAVYWYLSAQYMPEISEGFVVPMATDIVFANLIATIIFGKGNHPAKKYLMALAILDDLVGTILIPTVYGDGVDWIGFLPWFLLLLLVPAIMTARGISNKYAYILLSIPALIAFLHFGVHPAIAGIAIVWFMPHAKTHGPLYFPNGYSWDKTAEHGTLEEIEHWLRRGIVPFALFSFGLLNGGIPLGGGGKPTYIVLAALLVGKIVGIPLFVFVGSVLRLAKKPDDLRWADITVVGACASIGFTVSIFVANLAFEDQTILDHAKLGALFSFVGGGIAFAFAKLLRVKRVDLDPSAGGENELATAN